MRMTGAITIGLFLFASQTVANICTGHNDGDQLPNLSDCGSYYVCNYGEPTLFKCRSDLLYDSEKHVCNWAYMVNCGETPVVQPDITFPQYSTTTPAYQTTPYRPPYNGSNEIYPGVAETIPYVFECTEPDFYFAPHPRNCQEYFICENFRIHYHQCGLGIHWDYLLSQCDLPEKALCFSGTKPIDKIECPSSQAFIAHPKDCHKYYICIGGTSIVTSCPNKMAWDNDVLQCNKKALSQCLA